MYLVFIGIPCESYHRRLDLFCCVCVTSFERWLTPLCIESTSALGLVLFHIVTNRQTEYHQNDWQTLGKQVETQLCRAMEPTTKDSPAKVEQVVYRIDTNLTHEVYSGLTFLFGLLLDTWDTTSTSPLFIYLILSLSLASQELGWRWMPFVYRAPTWFLPPWSLSLIHIWRCRRGP